MAPSKGANQKKVRWKEDKAKVFSLNTAVSKTRFQFHMLHGQGGTRGNTPHSFHFTTSPQVPGVLCSSQALTDRSGGGEDGVVVSGGTDGVVVSPGGVVVVKMEWW